MMNFPAVSIRTSTERPESIDTGLIILGDITADSIIQATEISVKTFKKTNMNYLKSIKLKTFLIELSK